MSYTGLSAERLGEIIEIAKQEEREACAKLCDEGAYYGTADGAEDMAKTLAALIRARNDDPTAEQEVGQTQLST